MLSTYRIYTFIYCLYIYIFFFYFRFDGGNGDCLAAGHYYKMAGQEELEQFLTDPEKYVPPLAPRPLPEVKLLPKRIFPVQVKGREYENLGYCPVTYLDGKLR